MNTVEHTVSQPSKGLLLGPFKPSKVREVWAVFEWHKSVGWRRASQALWFHDRDDAEGQMLNLQRAYPKRSFELHSAKDRSIIQKD